MSDPIVLSDEEEDQKAFSTPLPSLSKKPRLEPHTNHTVLVIDDDPTPQKSLPSVVPETPLSILSSSEAAIMKCTFRCPVDAEARASSSEQKFSGISKFICLESDHESESGYRRENLEDNERMGSDAEQDSEWRSGFVEPTGLLGDDNLMNMPGGYSRLASTSEDAIPQVHDYSDKEYTSMEQLSAVLNQKTNKNNAEKELEKLENAALKAEAAELREQNKEKQVLENDKFSLRSIAAETDTKELEVQSVGGGSKFICLESDDESENDSAWENWKENETEDVGFDPLQDSEWRSGFIDFTGDDNMTNMPGCSFSHQTSSSEDVIHQGNVLNQNGDIVNAGKKHRVGGATRKKKKVPTATLR